MKIEEGKYYARADGTVHGPAACRATDTKFSWVVGGARYTEEGRFYGDQESVFDLVIEIPNGILLPTQEVVETRQAAFAAALPDHDAVNHPVHYTSHPSGVECIVVTEHMNFCRGNAMKYIWRAGDKGNELEDLRKARWYLDREIARVEKIGLT